MTLSKFFSQPMIYKMNLFKDCGCGCNGEKQKQKFIISIMSALLFFIVANPDTFRLMRAILGSWVSGPNGCPTTGGLILHTIVFMLITWGMMNVKRESYAPYEPEPELVEDAVTMKPPSTGPSPTGPSATGPSAVPRMVDMPSPQPGITEKLYGLVDSGTMFKSMDLTSEVDLPANIKKIDKSKKQAVTCSCTDGTNVVITP